jgi:hypothetical protein
VGSGSTPFATQRNVNSGGFAMIQGKMGDSASTSAGHVYSALVAGIEDNTNGAEDGYFALEVSEGGLGSEKLRVTSSGNVGIGTSPTSVNGDKVLEMLSTTGSEFIGYNNTAMASGELVASFIGRNDDGSSAGSPHYAGMAITSASIDGNMNVDFYSGISSYETFTNPTMRIDTSGNLLVGTTSAVTGNSLATVSTGITASSSTSPALQLYCSGAGSNQKYWRWTSKTTGEIRLEQVNDAYNSPTERMRIGSSGNVSIATTSTGGNAALTLSIGSFTKGMQFFANNGQASSTFEVSGTTVGSITHSTTSTAYNTSSDYRLKENVEYDWDATTRLKQLKPARFNFIADADVTFDGFLAHEVSSIVPEAIHGEKDAVDEEGNPKYQGIDQSKLVPLLVKTIQELEARITTLEGN